jgi:glycosyltransferase involved in cell wall biosynthesis
MGTEGWGESSVDEIVDALEKVYQNRQDAQQIGQRAAVFMQNWSWSRQVEALKQTILPYI